MVWQDIVFATGTWIFIIALMPTIRGKEKPPLITSVPTGLVVLVYTFTFATLELWFSVVSSAALSIAWLYLGWQKHMQQKRKR